MLSVCECIATHAKKTFFANGVRGESWLKLFFFIIAIAMAIYKIEINRKGKIKISVPVITTKSKKTTLNQNYVLYLILW